MTRSDAGQNIVMRDIRASDDLAHLLAEDACAVFWWAFRMRMPARSLSEIHRQISAFSGGGVR